MTGGLIVADSVPLQLAIVLVIEFGPALLAIVVAVVVFRALFSR